MAHSIRQDLSAGTVVKVTQRIPHRKRLWENEIRGTVVGYQQKPTGSWFAHTKNGRLFLDRLTIRRDDGEIVVLNLDEFSKIEIVPAPAEQPHLETQPPG